MPTFPFRKPLLPSHFSVWFDPPDEAGDEVLHIVSERRSIVLKGHSFREFYKSVMPFLDGHHTVEEIHEATRDIFDAGDLAESFRLLGEQGVLVEGHATDLPTDVADRIAPQLNFFHDVAPGMDLQGQLVKANVAVLGLGGVGATTAMALGAAGIGTVRCIDESSVTPADTYFAPFLRLSQVGRSRATATADAIRAAAPQVNTVPDPTRLQTEEDIRASIAGSDLVVNCLDSAQSNLTFKLNRVCLANGIRWITCALSGLEVIVGPAFEPGTGPCYLCYRMRVVACAGNPEEAFAYERYLDRRKRDDSNRRENTVFGAGIVANLIGLEVVKMLTGFSEPSLVGRILTIHLNDLAVERHMILRKPWCPACFSTGEANHVP